MGISMRSCVGVVQLTFIGYERLLMKIASQVDARLVNDYAEYNFGGQPAAIKRVDDVFKQCPRRTATFLAAARNNRVYIDVETCRELLTYLVEMSGGEDVYGYIGGGSVTLAAIIAVVKGGAREHGVNIS